MFTMQRKSKTPRLSPTEETDKVAKHVVSDADSSDASKATQLVQCQNIKRVRLERRASQSTTSYCPRGNLKLTNLTNMMTENETVLFTFYIYTCISYMYINVYISSLSLECRRNFENCKRLSQMKVCRP